MIIHEKKIFFEGIINMYLMTNKIDLDVVYPFFINYYYYYLLFNLKQNKSTFNGKRIVFRDTKKMLI
jgi:hypothetical protein